MSARDKFLWGQKRMKEAPDILKRRIMALLGIVLAVLAVGLGMSFFEKNQGFLWLTAACALGLCSRLAEAVSTAISGHYQMLEGVILEVKHYRMIRQSRILLQNDSGYVAALLIPRDMGITSGRRYRIYEKSGRILGIEAAERR